MVEAFVNWVYPQISQELRFISKEFDTIHDVLAQQYQALQSGSRSGLQLYWAKGIRIAKNLLCKYLYIPAKVRYTQGQFSILSYSTEFLF